MYIWCIIDLRWLDSCMLLLTQFNTRARIAKNKHGFNTAIILFAQCFRYLSCIFRDVLPSETTTTLVSGEAECLLPTCIG